MQMEIRFDIGRTTLIGCQNHVPADAVAARPHPGQAVHKVLLREVADQSGAAAHRNSERAHNLGIT
jgi:hypothetical protein